MLKQIEIERNFCLPTKHNLHLLTQVTCIIYEGLGTVNTFRFFDKKKKTLLYYATHVNVFAKNLKIN